MMLLVGMFVYNITCTQHHTHTLLLKAQSALQDSGLSYSAIEQVVVGYVYGKACSELANSSRLNLQIIDFGSR